MANTKVFVLVLCFAVCVGMCWAFGEEVVENAKDVANDAKENSESFAGWAYDKIAQGLGFKGDDEKKIAENAKFQTEDATAKATESVKSTASGAYKYAAKAAADAKEKAKEAYDEAEKQTGKASNIVGNKATDAYDEAKRKTGKASNIVGNKATDAYDQAKYKVGEAYKSTKDTVTTPSKN